MSGYLTSQSTVVSYPVCECECIPNGARPEVILYYSVVLVNHGCINSFPLELVSALVCLPFMYDEKQVVLLVRVRKFLPF